MTVFSIRIVVLVLLLPTIFAVNPVEKRQISEALINQSWLDGFLKTILGIKPKKPPNSIADAQSILQSILSSTPKDPTSLFHKVEKLLEYGFLAGELSSVIAGLTSNNNSASNLKNPIPGQTIHPSKSSSDAPYSVPEIKLRAALVIPPSFTYGKKPPTILIPGTGDTAYFIYAPNYIKLLANVDYADPVWVNIPQFMLGNSQVNAEYVAYAINYISSLTKKNVSVIGISQGGPAIQWALKYWPSTRSVVTDFIAFSPDFHGTTLAYSLCHGLPILGCTPAVVQQEYNSNFIKTLRSNGGDSAYVPTTTIYSETDDVVQPQTGTNASAFLLDAHNVGVSNTDIQATCPGKDPAGGYIDHGGPLFNALAYALVVDALTHPGPGQLSRLNLTQVCAEAIAPGLTVVDMMATESNIIIVLVTLILYPWKIGIEPPIASYAIGH